MTECIDDEELRDIINKNIIEQKTDEPFFLVNLNNVLTQYIKWLYYLPDIKPFFAIKSNPDKKIIQLLANCGCNFDCASKNEIDTVLNIVNDPSRIIFANPCKSISHIIYAKEKSVDLMTFDSIEELVKINTYYKNAKLVLRICVDDSKSLCKFNSKFGCKLNDINDILQKVKEIDCNLIGISFHVGSGCKSADSYYDAINDCRTVYLQAIKNEINTIKIIDIGGGFEGSDKNILFTDVCKKIQESQKLFYKDYIGSGLQFIAEPGRFFTETSYTLILNVIAKKKCNNLIKYYLNDGLYGSFNCIHYDHQKPQLIPLKINLDINVFTSTFFGPTCDSMDVIYKNILFTELNVGDWLYVKNFGSYTISPSTTFNGFSVNNYKYIDIL
jgi:ornithine decarboxylase